MADTFMNISDLQPKQGNANVKGIITEKGDVREFQKFGKPGRVCNAKLKDASGNISLTLWNDEIDQVNVGDKIKILNGFVSEWQGQKQLSAGKFGNIEKE
ncbi:MAG: SOSS complex subunit B family protein [archaeon]